MRIGPLGNLVSAEAGMAPKTATNAVSMPSNTVYTFGTRDGQWTIEGLNWTTGESTFHYLLGGARYNALGGTPQLDIQGRFIWSGPFGLNRLENR